MYGPPARLSTLAVAGALYVATSTATTQPATPTPAATPTQPATVTQPATPSPVTTTSAAPVTTSATGTPTATPNPTESLLPNRPRDGAGPGPVRREPTTSGPDSEAAAGAADHARSTWSSLLPAPQTGLKIFAAGLLALAISIGGLAAMAIRRRTP